MYGLYLCLVLKLYDLHVISIRNGIIFVLLWKIKYLKHEKAFFLLAAVSIMGLISCSDDSSKTTTTTTGTDSTAKSVAPTMDSGSMSTSSTTTTTKTTTTTVTTRNLENRNLMTLKTNKPIKLVYNPEKSYYVDATTNKEPAIMYYYDPSTNDTFDYRGYIVNNALMNNNGTWKVNETKLMDNPYNVQLHDSLQIMKSMPQGDMKMKQRGDNYKEKTDTSKLKVNDHKIKVKTN